MDKEVKTKWLPALIMLTAGAVDCVLSIAENLSMFAFTVRLLVVLVVFFALGSVVQWIVIDNFPQMADVPEIEEDAAGDTVSEIDAEKENEEEELENINAENESE